MPDGEGLASAASLSESSLSDRKTSVSGNGRGEELICSISLSEAVSLSDPSSLSESVRRCGPSC